MSDDKVVEFPRDRIVDMDVEQMLTMLLKLVRDKKTSETPVKGMVIAVQMSDGAITPFASNEINAGGLSLMSLMFGRMALDYSGYEPDEEVG